MVKTYTPEERAERRRRSSDVARRNRESQSTTGEGGRPAPLVDEEEASWIADLRAQGVDVDEFLTAAFVPPEDVNVPDDGGDDGNDARRRSSVVSEASIGSTGRSDRSGGSLPRRISRVQHSSAMKRLGPNERARQRFTQFLDKSYEVDEETGDLVMKTFEEMSRERWRREVEEDSRNYVVPSSSSARERIEQNREWALKMALRRAAEAGYGPASDDVGVDSVPDKPTFPRVDPPPTEPLPPMNEDDFDAVPMPKLNPRELGIFPPSIPHNLVELVPKVERSRGGGIAAGVLIEGTLQEGRDECDAETMVVRCAKEGCSSYQHCPRTASLFRCEACNGVCPACPETITQRGRRPARENDVLSNSGSSINAVRGADPCGPCNIAGGGALTIGDSDREIREFIALQRTLTRTRGSGTAIFLSDALQQTKSVCTVMWKTRLGQTQFRSMQHPTAYDSLWRRSSRQLLHQSQSISADPIEKCYT